MGSMAFGRYRLIAEIGHGGMADVFLALQDGPLGSGFSKLTVIKRLRQNLVEEPEFVAMLVDEARIAARLNHPNVVQTNEVGNVGTQYFIAMEYLDGQPLHRLQHRTTHRAREGEPRVITPEHEYVILMDALAGLHHAHELVDYDGSPLQIVHRDVTPHNIFVTYEGQVKVMDFGIAKAAGRTSETRQGVVKGKVRYMAPEQAIGLNVTRQADIFSVGVMLWEAAMMGRRMWTGKDDGEIVRALLAGDFPPMPRELNPDVPEAIDKICRKALAIRAEDRYATAEELRLDLEDYLTASGHLLTKRRSLGPVVAEFFKDKREEIRALIEEQVAKVDAAKSTSRLLAFPQDPVSKTSLAMAASTSDVVASSEVLDSPPPVETSGGRTPKRGRQAILAVGAALLVAGGVFWGTTNARSKADAQVPAKAPAAQVSVRLQSNASMARASIDDLPFQALPVDVSVPRDERPHRVRIEAEGYEPRTEEVSFTSDVSMQLDLVRKPIAPPSASHSARPPSPPPQPPPKAHAAPPWRPPPRAAEPPRTEPKAEPTPSATAHVPPPSPEPVPAPAPTPAPSAKERNLSFDKSDPWAPK